MDKYQVLLIVGGAIFILFCWFITLRRMKKFKAVFGDKYEKILCELQKANLQKDAQDKELSDKDSLVK